MRPIPEDNHYVRIYRTDAQRYDALVSAEDADGHLLPALDLAFGALRGRTVAEIGAGTGRLTTQLVRAGATVHATDAAQAMLDVARKRLAATGVPSDKWSLEVADARALPFEARTYDGVVAGWVLGHFNSWFGTAWRDEVNTALDEMRRVARPAGVLAILETLGTGTEGPGAPSEGLSRYYEHLEAEGFERTTLQTDYVFSSVEEAADICGNFFGEAFGEHVRQQRWTRVPEWTGLWVRRV